MRPLSDNVKALVLAKLEEATKLISTASNMMNSEYGMLLKDEHEATMAMHHMVADLNTIMEELGHEYGEDTGILESLPTEEDVLSRSELSYEEKFTQLREDYYNMKVNKFLEVKITWSNKLNKDGSHKWFKFETGGRKHKVENIDDIDQLLAGTFIAHHLRDELIMRDPTAPLGFRINWTPCIEFQSKSFTRAAVKLFWKKHNVNITTVAMIDGEDSAEVATAVGEALNKHREESNPPF